MDSKAWKRNLPVYQDEDEDADSQRVSQLSMDAHAHYHSSVPKRLVHVFDDVDESSLFPEAKNLRNVIKARSTGYFSYEQINDRLMTLGLDDREDAALANLDALIDGRIAAYEAEKSKYSTCYMTYICQIELGGVLLPQFIQIAATSFLNQFVVMRKHFCKDHMIDFEKRERMIKKIKQAPKHCTR